MKELSRHAMAAKLIRQELKNAFPKIKFSVKSRSYSGGNSVDIEWENGITNKQVKDIVKKYQYGHFDGMTDSYEYSNVIKDIPQVQFVMDDRRITEDIYNQAFEYVRDSWDCFKGINDIDESSQQIMKTLTTWTARHWLSRILYRMDLTNGLTKEKLKEAIFNRQCDHFIEAA